MADVKILTDRSGAVQVKEPERVDELDLEF